MSIQRVFIWTCDECEGTTSSKAQYGIPSQWKWRHVKGVVQHSCPECSDKLEREGWKLGKEDANQLVK